jgi:hypothetical protein
MGRLGITEIIVISILLFLIYRVVKFLRKNNEIKQEVSNNIEKEKNEEVIVNIPEVCPHCKNPNTKKVRLCEWCGNQII